MTIHNIYVAVGFTVWLLLLLVLYIRVTAARLRRFLRRRAKSRIAAAFSPDCSRKKCQRICRKFYRYARDEQLFSYICDCYESLGRTGRQTDRSGITRCMVDLMDRRISDLQEEDPIRRLQLVQNIDRTQVTSERIDRFLRESSRTSFQSGDLVCLKAAR